MIDISDGKIFGYEILYLIINFSFLIGPGGFRDIFEFYMYAGRDTHRFCRRYYKVSSFKRRFMLTVFDEELMKESKYQKQIKSIFWSYIVFKIITLILFILRCIFTLNKSIPIWFAVIYSIYFISIVIFEFWVFAHQIDDWRQWFKRYPKTRAFYMTLPGEKPKKKKRKYR